MARKLELVVMATHAEIKEAKILIILESEYTQGYYFDKTVTVAKINQQKNYSCLMDRHLTITVFLISHPFTFITFK